MRLNCHFFKFNKHKVCLLCIWIKVLNISVKQQIIGLLIDSQPPNRPSLTKREKLPTYENWICSRFNETSTGITRSTNSNSKGSVAVCHRANLLKYATS
jgi:hypothetical protein